MALLVWTSECGFCLGVKMKLEWLLWGREVKGQVVGPDIGMERLLYGNILKCMKRERRMDRKVILGAAETISLL